MESVRSNEQALTPRWCGRRDGDLAEIGKAGELTDQAARRRAFGVEPEPAAALTSSRDGAELEAAAEVSASVREDLAAASQAANHHQWTMPPTSRTRTASRYATVFGLSSVFRCAGNVVP